uniref:Uncharacterized protein n=1 Tax=uncultured marine virus TaxID=186617 RepID=A0A0F7L634_9VIRU|nr:hypothetical protein [uncultured marine virus]
MKHKTFRLLPLFLFLRHLFLLTLNCFLRQQDVCLCFWKSYLLRCPPESLFSYGQG